MMPRKSEADRKDKQKKTKRTPKKVKGSTRGKKNIQKVDLKDGIEVSKQLLAKRNSAKRSPRSKKNNDLKIYENAKPMPGLADLEKMFEDSDDENSNRNTCKTPSKQSTENNKDNNMLSPNSIQTIAMRLMDKISNINPVVLLDELPPSPVVPPKKRKIPDQHYIVGCKDRPQVPWKPTTHFCRGSDDYGVDPNICIEDEIPKKREKRSRFKNPCTSLFNAKSDEIAVNLRDSLSDSSNTSSGTIPYDFNDDCQNIIPSSFSPLPSTSKDNETITKNDELFNKSCTINMFYDNRCSTDLENSNDEEFKTKDIEILETPIETIVLDDELLENESHQQTVENDDSVQIIKPLPKIIGNESPIIIDDYSSCFDSFNTCDDIIEIIDVDEIIAENKSIIEKYKNKNSVETLITVNNSVNSACLEPTPNKKSVEQEASDNAILNNNTPMNNSTTVNEDAVPDVAAEQVICIDDSNIVNISSDQLVLNPIDPPYIHNNIVTSSPYGRRNRINIDRQRNRKPATPKNTAVKTAMNPAKETPLQGSDGFSECPICMESLKGKIASTLCGHVFCMECIKKSIKAIGKKCPKCRKTLKGAGFIQIFL